LERTWNWGTRSRHYRGGGEVRPSEVFLRGNVRGENGKTTRGARKRCECKCGRRECRGVLGRKKKKKKGGVTGGDQKKIGEVSITR